MWVARIVGLIYGCVIGFGGRVAMIGGSMGSASGRTWWVYKSVGLLGRIGVLIGKIPALIGRMMVLLGGMVALYGIDAAYLNKIGMCHCRCLA